MEHPKPKTYHNEKYLAFVREHPCLVCGKKAVAHHESGLGIGLVGGGTSKKCSDLAAVPLCCRSIDEHNYNACHQRREDEGYATFWGNCGGIINNFNRLNADGIVMREIIKLHMEWIEKEK